MVAARALDMSMSGSRRLTSATTTESAETGGRAVAYAPTSGAASLAAGSSLATRATAGSVWPGTGVIAKTAGRVFFTITGGADAGRNASCSGSAVTSTNKSVVITAGHCVKINGSFHANWMFVPGFDSGNRPFGNWVATNLFTTPQWNASEDLNFDVAAAVVAPLNGQNLVDVVGGQGIAFNQARGRQMYSFGYPAASPFDGSKLIFCAGRTINDPIQSNDLGLNCTMTGGSSGGPWFLNFNEQTGAGILNSVNSFKYNFAPNFMFGPFFGNDAQAVYNAAQSQGAQ
jgi:V8-like Glu-specific endopeptidase